MIKIICAKKKDRANVMEILTCCRIALHKRGIMQWESEWNEEDIDFDTLHSRAFLLNINKKNAGVFFIKEKNHCPFFPYPVLYLYQIAILPAHQGKRLIFHITDFAIDLAKKQNKPIYLDCYSGNEKLKHIYRTCGFNYCFDKPENDYNVSVFLAAEMAQGAVEVAQNKYKK